MNYTVVFKPYDGGYVVTVPDVPGCATGGASVSEAIDMAKDALCGCLCVYQDEGIPLPSPRLPNEITLNDGEFPVLIDIDLLRYRAETDTRAVRKNVSMPAWLSNLADRRGINCSQVLQDALKRALNITC